MQNRFMEHLFKNFNKHEECYAKIIYCGMDNEHTNADILQQLDDVNILQLIRFTSDGQTDYTRLFISRLRMHSGDSIGILHMYRYWFAASARCQLPRSYVDDIVI